MFNGQAIFSRNRKNVGSPTFSSNDVELNLAHLQQLGGTWKSFILFKSCTSLVEINGTED